MRGADFRRMKEILLIAFLLINIGNSGCTYTYTNSRPFLFANIHTVAVPHFINTTLEPRIEAYCTYAFRKSLSESSKLKITDEQSADAVIIGEVSGFAEGVNSRSMTESKFLLNKAPDVPIQEVIRFSVTLKVFDRSNGRQIYQTTVADGGGGAYNANTSSVDYFRNRLGAISGLCNKLGGLFASRFTSSF